MSRLRMKLWWDMPTGEKIIKTNGQNRPVIPFVSLPWQQQGKFEYTAQEGHERVPRMFEYRGVWYDVREFEPIIPEMGWQAQAVMSKPRRTILVKGYDPKATRPVVVVGCVYW